MQSNTKYTLIINKTDFTDREAFVLGPGLKINTKSGLVKNWAILS